VTDWDKDVDPAEMMAFIRQMGAVSIKEAKEHFGVNSKSARRAFAKLWYHNKVWIIPYRRALYATENTGKKGAPNIAKLKRVWADGHDVAKPRSKPNPEKIAEALRALDEDEAAYRVELERKRRAFERGEYYPNER
jgi:hypothetical protein